MSVLVDTSVWSLAFRRKAKTSGSAVAAELAALIRDGRACIMGPIRQELLSGVRSTAQFKALRDSLRAFPDIEVDVVDYEDAADFSNRCRAKGIQGSSVDFLICAVAARRQLAIFTTDGDFAQFQSALDFQLHPLPS